MPSFNSGIRPAKTPCAIQHTEHQSRGTRPEWVRRICRTARDCVIPFSFTKNPDLHSPGVHATRSPRGSIIIPVGVEVSVVPARVHRLGVYACPSNSVKANCRLPPLCNRGGGIRPVLANDGGVVVRVHRPLRLEQHKNNGVLLDPPPLLKQGRQVQEHRPTRKFCVSRICVLDGVLERDRLERLLENAVPDGVLKHEGTMRPGVTVCAASRAKLSIRCQTPAPPPARRPPNPS